MRLTLIGVLLIAAGAVLGAYVANTAGAFDAIGGMLPRVLPGTPVSRGEQIYRASCASCHGGATGGTLRDYPPRHNANGHTWQHGDCEIEATIRTAVALQHDVVTRPASPPAALAMPAWDERLSDTQISDVIAFIKTMWTNDQRAAQERTTKERCSGSTLVSLPVAV